MTGPDEFPEAQRAYASGQLAPAHAICLRLLERNRKDTRALRLLAAIENDRGLHDDALKYLKRAAKLQPNEPAFVYQIGRTLAAQGRTEEAIAKFDEALRATKGDARIVQSKAVALERVGDHASARRLLEPFVRRGGESGIVAGTWARALIQDRRHADAAAYLEARLAANDFAPPERKLLLFTLAKACDGAGDCDRAFAACREANGIDPAFFDIDRYRAMVDAIIAMSAPETIATLAKASNRSDVPVFVTGMPRSGTTLVEQILDSHPAGHGAGELVDVTRAADTLPGQLGSSRPFPEWIADLTPDAADRVADAYLSRLRSARREAKRVVNKSLDSLVQLGLIAQLWPAARVVLCRRDPRDTCLSCYMNPILTDRHAYIGDLRSLGLVCRENARLAAHWKDALPLPVTEVIYEEMIGDQERVTRGLIDFAGLEWDDACLSFHESERTVMTLSYDQVTRPIYRDSVARWKRYEKHLGPLLEALEVR